MLVLNDEAAKIGTDDSAETRATSPIGGSTAHFEQSPFLGPSKNTFITYIQWTGTHVCVGVARRGGVAAVCPHPFAEQLEDPQLVHFLLSDFAHAQFEQSPFVGPH